MQYNHDEFGAKNPCLKHWARPVLTETKLTDEEMQIALSSPDAFRALGTLLKAQGRI